MEKYNYIEIYYPAQPRSKHLQGTVQTSTGSILVSGGSGTGSVTSDFDIFQGDGIQISKNTDTRLSYTISHAETSEIENTENENAFIIQNLEFDNFGHVKTAESIRATDLFDDRYLRKDIDDTAHGNILFDKKIGSSIFLDGYNGKGWEVTNQGAALFDSAQVRSNIFLGGKFRSPSFASGFTGHGVEIDIPSASGTVDHWTVRKSMKVYELVYSQIYGLGGSVIISDLNKILSVEKISNLYRCYLDTLNGQMRMNLRKDDIVRMQRSSGINIRYFYGEIVNITANYFDLKVIDGEDYPETGDVVFRFGSKSDYNRQGLIYLTSSDDDAPYIDVLDGITDSSMHEKVKVRMGNLRGIRTKHGVDLDKYGIYASGAVFEDTDIYLEDGTTVSQQFSIMNGKFESTIEGIRNDMSLEAGNILKNSSFGSNLNYWKSTNDISFINSNAAFLWMPDAFYSEKRSVSDIYRDGNKNVLRIRNSNIYQSNDVMGVSKKEGLYSFAFYYKVLQPGTLTMGFSGQELFLNEELEVTDGYKKQSKLAQWDATGDFNIRFTGEILIYGVSLFNDALADAEIRLQTQIFQNEEKIALRATKEYVDNGTEKTIELLRSELSVTANQITANVERWTNGVLRNYATTTWTADQIRNFVTNTEMSSKLEQKADSLTLSFNNKLSPIQDITNAFYKFDSTRMYTNRRIELGWTVSNIFYTYAGLSPRSNENIAFWAGGTWEDAVNGTSAVKITHSGTGYLAKKNISWDDNGNLTIKGTVEARAGKIAGFTIDGNYLTNSGSNNDASIIFKNESHNVYAGIGGNLWPSSTGQRCIARFENYDSTGEWGDSNYALIVGADKCSPEKNHAIVMESGFISGLAWKPRKITVTTTLHKHDVYVTCYNTIDISVYLPANPTPGKVIFIKKMHSNQVTVHGNNKSIVSEGSPVTSKTWGARGDCGIFYYDGQYWCFNYMVR